MKTLISFTFCLITLSCTVAWARVTTTGEISPAGPTTWTDSTIAYVGQNSDATITVDGGSTITSLRCQVGQYSNSTATITGVGSLWNNMEDFYVGSYGDCSLDITNGGSFVNGGTAIIGHIVTSDSTTTVSGTNSTWNNGEEIYIGYYGIGELNITNGGSVENTSFGIIGNEPDSKGTLNVSGLNSTWTDHAQLHVGNGGTGEVNITDHGTVSTTGSVLGVLASGIATATVSGTGSTWNNSELLVIGHEGTGELSVTDGAAVISPTSCLGNATGSSGTVNVSGTGSTFNNSSDIFLVGSKGYGELNITDGGTVHALWASASDDIDSTSKITVSGSGSAFHCENGLYIGGYGDSSELNITNGGSVNNTIGTLGLAAGATGIANVSGPGALWTNNNTFDIGKSGTGVLNITDGGTVVNNALTNVGTLTGGKGTITVSGIGSTWTNNDSLCLGVSGAGELTITNGGLTTVSTRLWLDTNNQGNSFINMSTGGMLALKGNVDDSLAQFLSLSWGTDAIRWWDDSIDNWNYLFTAVEGTDYTLEYQTDGDLAGYTILTVGTVPVLVPGDANGDGVVNGSDVTILAANWQVGVADGLTATQAIGDFNGDGRVDGSDVTILAGNWQYGVTTAAVAVPEPGMIGFVFSALFAMGIGGVRKVHCQLYSFMTKLPAGGVK